MILSYLSANLYRDVVRNEAATENSRIFIEVIRLSG